MKSLQVKVWNDRKVPNVFRKTAPCCTWFGAQMVVEHRAGPRNTSLQVPGIRAAAKGPDPHSPAFLLWIKFISICFLDSFGSFTFFFFLFLLFDWINIIPRDSIWTSGNNTISLERSAVQKKKDLMKLICYKTKANTCCQIMWTKHETNGREQFKSLIS